MKKAIQECARFHKCNVNICPLDNLSHLRNKLNDEPRCGMAKNIRLRIGMKYGLPKLGLTNREFSSHQRWEGRPEEEKNQIRKVLAENAFQDGHQNCF